MSAYFVGRIKNAALIVATTLGFATFLQKKRRQRNLMNPQTTNTEASRNQLEDTVISSGWHWTYGWMRRPGLDRAYNGYVYEDGDGDIMIFKEPLYKRSVYLECREDVSTGERYLCVSHVPKVCNWKRKRQESRRLKRS